MQCLKSVMRTPVRMEAYAQYLLVTSSASAQKTLLVLSARAPQVYMMVDEV